MIDTRFRCQIGATTGERRALNAAASLGAPETPDPTHTDALKTPKQQM
jgi:hypothetical protein